MEKAKTEREKAEAGRLELEKQVLALVEKTKVRTVSKKAKDEMAFLLRSVPKGHIEIIAFDKDPGSITFGLDLKKALSDDGCDVSFSPRSILNLDAIPGLVESGSDLVFCVKDSENPPFFSMLILAALNRDGIKAEGWPYDSTISGDSIKIYVCPKAAHADE